MPRLMALLLALGMLPPPPAVQQPTARSAPAARAASQPASRPAQAASGVVYHDANGNGRRDGGEAGIPGARVSNGREVVQTDAEGRYRTSVGDDTILFVIQPAGWVAPLNANRIPQFFYRHKPGGSPPLKFPGVEPTGPLPASVDFGLQRCDNPSTFEVLLFGDTQPRDQREIDYIAHDVIEELAGSKAAFGVTLGDILFDDLSLFESLNRTIALLGVRWHYVLGNHDMNYDAADDEHSDETYERFYGPSCYAFDYGQAHFVVLDDVMWHPAAGDKKAHYTAGVGDAQMEFLRNDLALVPRDTLVVLMMHIPLVEVAQRDEILRLLAPFPHTLSISAHEHYQETHFMPPPPDAPTTQPHVHLVNNTVCGSWWTGAPDELGIPHATMRDGAPNGYTIATFEGNRFRLRFKAARRPAEHQMSIWAPEAVRSADAASTSVLVNVFAGTQRSTVEMRFGESEEWRSLERRPERDPYFAAMKQLEQGMSPPPGRKLPDIIESPHIWGGPLPADPAPGTYFIHVRTTDMFGQTYESCRVIRIE